MNVELRERDFGELLRLCFQLPIAHFGKLFVLFFVLGLPTLPMQIKLVPLMRAAEDEPTIAESFELMGWALFVSVVLMILSPIMQGSSILAISGSFTGKHLPTGTCLKLSLKRFFALLVYSLVTGMIMGLGLILFVVPYFIFMTWFFVGPSAIMMEKISWDDAMLRSRELTKGHRWSMFGMFLTLGFILFIINYSFTEFLKIIPIPDLAVAILTYLSGTLVNMFAFVVPVVYYFQLRVVKEAFDVENLSSLVDAIAVRKEMDA